MPIFKVGMRYLCAYPGRPAHRPGPPGSGAVRAYPRGARGAPPPHPKTGDLPKTGNLQVLALTRKMAVHELYLSFEARLAPVLHTIDDPNHDGHKNGQEKHCV